MNEWYYRLDGETLGPISQEGLLSLINNGELPTYTAVKNDDMEAWREARSLDILFPMEEQTRKLPIWNTIGDAFHLMLKKAPILWNKLFFISFILMATNMIVLTPENMQVRDFFFWGTIIINFIAGVMFVVTIHRVVLLENTKVSMAGGSWSLKEWKFIFYSVVFYFLISLTTFVPMLLIITGGQQMMMLLLLNPIGMYVSMFVLGIVVWYVSARLSLVFPAIAVEKEDVGFGWAMNLSSGNGWRLMMVLFIIPFLIAYVIPKFYGLLFGLNVLLEIIRTVLSVFEVILLSVSFQYLSDFKEKI